MAQFRFGAGAATPLVPRCTLAYAVTDAAAAAEELAERRLGERVYKLLGFVVTKALASHRSVCVGCVHYGHRSGNTTRRWRRQVASNAEIWRIYSKLHQSAGDSKMVLECQLRRQRALQSAGGPFCRGNDGESCDQST